MKNPENAQEENTPRKRKSAREIVDQMNIIDDMMFRKMVEDIGFCEETLSTILGRKIKVIKTDAQKNIPNLQGRSVILDALCEDDKGKRYNIEVQKADNDDHQRRVRYYASCITANVTETGSDFKGIPDVIIIYITEFDIFNQGNTMYHIDRVIRENGGVVENGLTEIYVNTAVHEDSDVSELMSIFSQVDKYDTKKFPNVSKRKEQYKKDEKGVRYMSSLVEEYARDVAKEYRAEGKAEGQAIGEARGQATSVDSLIKSLGLTPERACEIIGITVEKYKETKASMQ